MYKERFSTAAMSSAKGLKEEIVKISVKIRVYLLRIKIGISNFALAFEKGHGGGGCRSDVGNGST
ncbi:MAG: hypothetical protein K2I18_00005, partial [Paramuribaculum sp.]|nr:hypothetical protein [Paramuribaculum sp.]